MKTAEMILKLTNNLTKTEINLDVNDNKVSTKFWNFNISLPEDMLDGEYSYELTDQGNLCASGLVQIGDYKPERTEYNEKEEYVVYNG